MSENRPDVELSQPVAFRPPWLEVPDHDLGEHTRGHAPDLAPDTGARPGSVPPPLRSRPAPTGSLRERSGRE
jgi:hypothetical protein